MPRGGARVNSTRGGLTATYGPSVLVLVVAPAVSTGEEAIVAISMLCLSRMSDFEIVLLRLPSPPIPSNSVSPAGDSLSIP